MADIERRHKTDEGFEAIKEKWLTVARVASHEEKDKIAHVYISKLLGLGDEVADKFALDDDEVWDMVGEKQRVISADLDTSFFWGEINKIFPDLHTDQEIKVLNDNESRVTRAVDFVYSFFSILSNENSPVFQKLAVNAFFHLSSNVRSSSDDLL